MHKLATMLQDDPRLEGLREEDGSWGVYAPNRYKIVQDSEDVVLRRQTSQTRSAIK